MRDFLNVYTNTGRKINIMQTATAEASLFTKEIKAGKKLIPDKDSSSGTKEVDTNGYTKLISASKCPKYNMK
jgi:hypothetical protein